MYVQPNIIRCVLFILIPSKTARRLKKCADNNTGGTFLSATFVRTI